MRIGFLIDAFDIGGSELNAIKVAEALTSRGVTVTVFHFQTGGPLRQRYETLGTELIHVPLRGLLSRSAFDATRQIRREAKARGLALLHTHCVYSNIVGAGVRRMALTRLPLLASRRWTGYAVRPELHTLNAFAQTAADRVLVNSPSLERVVKAESRFAHPVYIPNLLPEANFAIPSAQERRQKREAFGLPADGLIAGCVARLVPVKDHRTLLTAWRDVVQALPHATLAIIGGGDLFDSLAALALELGISDHVRFTGEVRPDALPHSMLDVSVLASLDEGFPNSLLEAMAQRVPVLSTRVGGVSDLVTNDVNGLLVDKQNGAALSRALIQLMSDGALRERLAAGGSKTASTHRGDAVMNALLDTYRAIARV